MTCNFTKTLVLQIQTQAVVLMQQHSIDNIEFFDNSGLTLERINIDIVAS